MNVKILSIIVISALLGLSYLSFLAGSYSKDPVNITVSTVKTITSISTTTNSTTIHTTQILYESWLINATSSLSNVTIAAMPGDNSGCDNVQISFNSNVSNDVTFYPPFQAQYSGHELPVISYETFSGSATNIADGDSSHDFSMTLAVSPGFDSLGFSVECVSGGGYVSP